LPNEIKPLIDTEALHAGLLDALGAQIQRPKIVQLGDGDGNVFVDQTTVDDRRQVFVRNLPSRQSFRGRAYYDGAAGLDENAIVDGVRVYVKWDDNANGLVVTKAAPLHQSEFQSGVITATPQQPIRIDQFLPGLISATNPPTMKIRVMAAHYRSGDLVKYIGTQESIDFDTSGQKPVTTNEARNALVEIDFLTGLLSYKYGSVFNASLPANQVYSDLDMGSGVYFPQPSEGEFFVAGWVRLIANQTTIIQSHIWAAQQILGSASASFDTILTDDNGDVVSDNDGNVLTT
jgi:hypothetical protein